MREAAHTFDFVIDVMNRLARVQIVTWLSGGWTEELRGMCLPRPHQDVDLLYPAANFEQLDQWLAATTSFSEIPAKRFSHRRAFLYQRIMIEVILLESDGEGEYLTNFFNQRYQFIWPPEILSYFSVRGQNIPVASEEALQAYRYRHHSISEAYQNYLQRD